MAGAVRGIAGVAALMVALTACGGDGGADWTGEDGRPLTLDEGRMLMALPGKLSAPDGWKARDPESATGERALESCQEETGSNCAGLVAGGGGRYYRSGASDESDEKIKYSVYSFDTAENASVAMKGTVAQEREDAGSGARDLKVDTGAQAAEAFADGDGDSEVLMRAGAVLIRMQGSGVTDEKTLGQFARLQVERVRKAATGQNPDA
ncbi:hypothetical protein [Streptomyces roseolilacinus]|uniref:Lipoprotein n=1 Tax=Streptomyces roseolilacinus TaxID=66904 RepID=A0A918EL21_9ACTN|nr:hypothetical protein [Streptomyces roseolilacinus]GGQ02224.1 hypothetical protein GCM10010249_20940 [Streptomyces roseolilacinus]